MLKIMHIADIHLDSPFSLLDVQKAATRKNELRGTFSSAVMYAKMENIDLMLIAGDLFDGGFVTKETISFLCAQFASAPNCRFVIAPGNHDPYTATSPYAKTKWPDNVWIFENEALSCIHFDDIGADVYGYAFTAEKMMGNPLSVPPALNRNRVNLLVAHADLDAKVYCPVSKEDLARSSFDYAALGHIHLGGDIALAGNTYYAYCGCLEGRSFDECGIKGAVLCYADFENGKMKMTFKSRRFCVRHYEKMKVDLTDTVNTGEAIARIHSAVSANGFGSDTLLRLTLTGKLPAESAFRAAHITAEDVGVFYLETVDKTAPFAGYEFLKTDITIKGAFYRELLPLLESDDEEKRHCAALALRYGLAALAGENVADFEEQ